MKSNLIQVGRLATSGGAQLASTTPASAGLVLNSLAYQVILACQVLVRQACWKSDRSGKDLFEISERVAPIG